uniref:Uncharacterized protein n=1 Tax=Prevotella sp. GTC17254 TaxID=3236794 RepID=A0AB33IU37_9BACT
MCIAPYPSTDKLFTKCPKCGGFSIKAFELSSILGPVIMDGGCYPVKFKCLKCKHTFYYEKKDNK